MKDTHEKALEKATQKIQSQQGSKAETPQCAPLSNTTFESECQRAVAARQSEIGTYNGQNVQR